MEHLSTSGTLGFLRQKTAYKPVVYVLLGLTVFVLVGLVADLWSEYRFGSPGTKDFIEYWSAGRLVLEGQNPYALQALFKLQEKQGASREAWVAMWNPPWLVIWLLPLVLMPFAWAALIWMGVNGAFLLTGASFAWRTSPQSETAGPLGIAWVAGMAFVPALFTLQMGQVSSILLLGVAGFLYFAHRDQEWLAGAFLALTTVKPHVVYLVWIAAAWWVIVEHRWRVAAGTAAVLVPSCACLTILWPGWVAGYATALAEPPLYWQTPTLGTWLRFGQFDQYPFLQFVPTVLIGSVLTVYLILFKPKLNWEHIGGSLILLSVPTAAYGWSFDQVVLMVPYLQIVKSLTEKPFRCGMAWKALVLFGLILIAAGMIIHNQLRIADHFLFWVPWALLAAYFVRSRWLEIATEPNREMQNAKCKIPPESQLATQKTDASCLPRAYHHGFWFRVETGIFVGLWLWLLFIGSDGFFRDPGTYWHTKVGEHILSTARLITTDAFSFTCAGEPWISRQWLAECVMALLDRLGCFDGLLLGTATLLAGLYTWVAYRLICAGMNWVLAVLLVVLTLLASAYHLHARPHLVTLLLLGWTFARLCDFEAGRKTLRSLFWMVPVFVLWANAHDGMLGGLATLTLAVLGWTVYRLLGLSSSVCSLRQMLALAGLLIACTLTILVNPFGLELPQTWLTLLRSPVVAQVMAEHAPIWSRPVGLTVALFGLLYVAALLGTLPIWFRASGRGRENSPSTCMRLTWLIPLAWFVMACMRIRHGPLFAITAVLALAEMFPHIRWVRWLSRRGSIVFHVKESAAADAVDGRPDSHFRCVLGAAWRPALLPVVLVLVAIVIQITGLALPLIGRGSAKPDPSLWPMDLLPQLKALQASRSDPKGIPVFNDMLFGGFLIYHLDGMRVFIDDRCELYDDERLLAYAQAVLRAPGQVDKWAEEYHFELALVIPDSSFDRHLRDAEQWQRLGESKAANLYQRRTD